MTNSSPGSLTFEFTNNTDTTPTRFRRQVTPPLIGTADALNAPGEIFRRSSGKLYVWTPTGDSPASHDVVVQHRQYGFDLTGRSDIHLIGLNFFADTIATDSNSTGWSSTASAFSTQPVHGELRSLEQRR